MSKHDPKGFWANQLCADMRPYSDLLKVKNGYHNYTERVSFDLEILACKDSKTITCQKNTQKIDSLFDNLEITYYNYISRLEFKDQINFVGDHKSVL